jgi:hypothetical protein
MGAANGWHTIMTKLGTSLSGWVLTSVFVLGTMSAATLEKDLSKYRNFQLGTELAAIAKQVGASPSQATVVHRRPALIQELEWRPQTLGSASQTEAAKDVVFSFYDGALYRIAVSYDRYQTEGLTVNDFIDALSATYGTAAKPAPPAQALAGTYGEEEEVLARWEDPQYRFDLIRTSYGPTFTLVGVLKKLEAPAQAATIEAARLDEQEAPQREAARIAKEEDTARAALDKARVVNKPKFQP